MDIHDRYKNYSQNHCWQYQVKLSNKDKDLQEAGLTEGQVTKLSVNDFSFEYVDKTENDKCLEIKKFIEANEWLSTLPNRPTHRFICRHKDTGILGAAVIMAVPNAFSHILGKDNLNLEKLIARGASISWAPKNLGSFIVMASVRWMVKNTDFRYFTAYSDPEAKELGTIYQACNFYYLGSGKGTRKMYKDPNNNKLGWFSDREFRKKSKYAKYAANLGMSRQEWNRYMNKYSPNWDIIPEDLRIKIKEEEKKYKESCIERVVPDKHKYCYILGKDKKETKQLKSLFAQLNPDLDKIKFNYPKVRGV